MDIRLTFVQTFSTRFGQEFEVGSSREIWKLMFGQYFAADVSLRLRSSILVKILKLGLVNILNLKYRRDANVCLRF